MKYTIVFLAAVAISLITSCAPQHTCPTYSNSGIKYHHHPTHTSHH